MKDKMLIAALTIVGALLIVVIAQGVMGVQPTAKEPELACYEAMVVADIRGGGAAIPMYWCAEDGAKFYSSLPEGALLINGEEVNGKFN